jgi:hypothetical protein
MLCVVADRYSHIPNTIGIPVVTAGVLLAERGRAASALKTLEGALTTRLAARAEMSWAMTRRYASQLPAQLGPDARLHFERGRAMTRAALLATAEELVASTQSHA